jgi:hypothetical protein
MFEDMKGGARRTMQTIVEGPRHRCPMHAVNITIAADLQAQVTAGATKQNALLGEIMTLNDVFVKNKLTNPEIQI